MTLSPTKRVLFLALPRYSLKGFEATFSRIRSFGPRYVSETRCDPSGFASLTSMAAYALYLTLITITVKQKTLSPISFDFLKLIFCLFSVTSVLYFLFIHLLQYENIFCVFLCVCFVFISGFCFVMYWFVFITHINISCHYLSVCMWRSLLC